MSESYQKLRKDFKELDFTDRLTFLAESVLLTGQSAVVGSLNISTVLSTDINTMTLGLDLGGWSMRLRLGLTQKPGTTF